MVRVLGIGVTATVVAALLAGCGGSNPKPSPVSSPSTSVSASASGAPTMPAEAKGTTAASAEAFVRYYFMAYSYAARTGDTSTMKRLISNNCLSCINSIDLIEKTYAAGGHATGKGYSVQNLTSKPSSRGSAVLTGSIVQYAQQLVSSASALPSNYPRGSFTARFELRNENGLWRLDGLFVL